MLQARVPATTSATVIFAAGVASALLVVASLRGFVSVTADGVSYQDFHYLLRVVDAFWRGRIDGIYSERAYGVVLSELAGRPVPGAAPVAYSPLVVFLLWPFATLARVDPWLGYLPWVVLSMGALLAAARRALARAQPTRLDLLGFAALLFSSVVSLGLALGQPAALFAGLVYLLIEAARDPAPRSGYAIAAILLVLSVKPNVFCLGLMVPLMHRRYAAALGGCTVAALATFLASLVLEPGWLGRYAAVLGSFVATGPTPFTATGREEMAILREVARGAFADPSLLLASQLLLAALAVGGLALSLRAADEAARHRALVLPFAGFLLFSPSLGRYDDVLLLPLLLAAYARDPGANPWRAAALLGALAVFAAPLGLPATRALAWFAKAFVLVGLWMAASAGAKRDAAARPAVAPPP